GSYQNHSRLRTPPLPLSHSHSPSQHHGTSVGSLSRSNYTPRSNVSPAPTDSTAAPEGPSSAPDSGSAQDNWLLNSNIPLETRSVLRKDTINLCIPQYLECHEEGKGQDHWPTAGSSVVSQTCEITPQRRRWLRMAEVLHGG
ncbi:teneurin-4 isoform X5, partial [Tachysurus ichikawai]